jgi:hypothetical protein
VELDGNSPWDYVPHHQAIASQREASSNRHLDELRNGYWFAHERLQSRCEVVRGTAYDLPDLGLSGDIGLMANLLVHLRDPFAAISALAATCSETLVLIDVEPFAESRKMMPLRHLARRLPICQFIPDSKDADNDHTWWHLSAKAVERYVKRLGFKDTKTVYFTSGLKEGEIYQWGIIARKAGIS